MLQATYSPAESACRICGNYQVGKCRAGFVTTNSAAVPLRPLYMCISILNNEAPDACGVVNNPFQIFSKTNYTCTLIAINDAVLNTAANQLDTVNSGPGDVLIVSTTFSFLIKNQ